MSGEVRSIAVLRPNHRLGNTLLLMPLVQELQTHFPEAEITVVSGSGAAPGLFRTYERVHANHYLPSARPGQAAQMLRTLRALRSTRFDLAIDPIVRSRLGRFLLRYVRARARVGYRWGETHRDRVLTHAADPRAAPAHFTQAPIWLLRSAYLGQVPSAATDPLPMDLRLTGEERLHGARRLAATLGFGAALDSAQWRERPKVAVFAHATGQKIYPLSWWRELIGCFRDSPVQFLEIVPEDRQARLAGLIPGAFTPDLRLLGATLAASSLVVLADSGVMHLGEAAGARVLGLFRTTQPSQYAPLRAGSEGLWAPDATPGTIALRMRELLAAGPESAGAVGTAGAAAAGSGAPSAAHLQELALE